MATPSSALVASRIRVPRSAAGPGLSYPRSNPGARGGRQFSRPDHARTCRAHRRRHLTRGARVARAERAVHAIHQSIQPSRLSCVVHSVWTESRRLADWFTDCRTAVRRRDRAPGRACLPAADGLAQATTVNLELSVERGEQALL